MLEFHTYLLHLGVEPSLESIEGFLLVRQTVVSLCGCSENSDTWSRQSLNESIHGVDLTETLLAYYPLRLHRPFVLVSTLKGKHEVMSQF